jgi:predicted HTH transcriptional regulator
METLVLIIVAVVGIFVGFNLGRSDVRDHFSSLVNTERDILKERRKKMLLKHIAKRGGLTNGEAQELLGVSDSTIVRYFDELEDEAKIVQKGESGRGVRYEIL